jgi:hypothetical protein
VLRVRDLLLGLGCAGVILVAVLLEPSPAGWGTHQKLLLPPCWFRLVTGKPCATCGLTTSFCLLARGRVGEAFAANPAGLILFPLTALFGALALLGAATGRSLVEPILAWGARKAWRILVPGALLLWAWQLWG